MVEISPAGEPELEAVAILHAASFEAGWSVATFRDLMASPGVFLWQARTEVASGLAGFVLARIVADEAEILTIAVDATRRGQRIGERLMEALMAQALALKAEKLFLEVAEDNEAAIRLYTRMGFRELGRRPGYYRRGSAQIAALTMGLTLRQGPVFKHL